ncbi:hypothetical protein ACFL1J_01290 [Pseudomonadota bacterium]
MQSMIPALTDRQRFWLKNIQACEASGKSIAAYSAEQGIAARAMYGGKKVLVKKGVLATTTGPLPAGTDDGSHAQQPMAHRFEMPPFFGQRRVGVVCW